MSTGHGGWGNYTVHTGTRTNGVRYSFPSDASSTIGVPRPRSLHRRLMLRVGTYLCRKAFS